MGSRGRRRPQRGFRGGNRQPRLDERLDESLDETVRLYYRTAWSGLSGTICCQNRSVRLRGMNAAQTLVPFERLFHPLYATSSIFNDSQPAYEHSIGIRPSRYQPREPVSYLGCITVEVPIVLCPGNKNLVGHAPKPNAPSPGRSVLGSLRCCRDDPGLAVERPAIWSGNLSLRTAMMPDRRRRSRARSCAEHARLRSRCLVEGFLALGHYRPRFQLASG